MDKEWNEIKKELKNLKRKIEMKQGLISLNYSSKNPTPTNQNFEKSKKQIMKEILKVKPS